jgi:hypothetical protein
MVVYNYMFVKKERGKLILRDPGGVDWRNPSTFWCIQEADKIYKWQDFPELKIYTGDAEEHTDGYAYSRNGSFVNLVPDFHFHQWRNGGFEDYTDFVKKIDKAGRSKAKIHKIGWIGDTVTSPVRRDVHKIADQHTDLFDFIDMKWQPHLDGKTSIPSRFISTPELVTKYGVLIDIEGYGYSGRLKHLLWSHRPVLLVERPYTEYFMPYLKPFEHYIPVKRDLSDLVEKAHWCLNNNTQVAKIAENAYNFACKYLTRESAFAKWNDVMLKHIASTAPKYSITTIQLPRSIT